ncbi:bifunctional serine/threonine-protein kinase/ABC transporter substrate-binding protein [Streptomyces tendae]
MRPLVTGDPEEVGGHRLLARLGAGGMGVVYLARTPGGALVALKTIHAEHTADPAFRARFRREVAAVRHLAERSLVPVVAADPEAREPWLATEFVPGPSLAEAVDGFGALPVASVRALGCRLAGALGAVHGAGVVHRDVKPGNVLLTTDGPRLIDFGIARGAGATALTAPDAVVGTPGFLAPEQARARAGEVGPPGDVFSLGCVLAYAASGRRPFGTGHAAGILFRTVHEEPDLTEVPGELRRLIGACLAKDPARRPTAGRVAAALRDPRAALGRDGPATAEQDWLPPDILRVVAERSVRALDVPTPRRPTPLSPARQPPGDAAAGTPVAPAGHRSRPPTRRRILLTGSAVTAVAAGGGVAAYLSAARGDTDGALPVHTLGFQGDLSGGGRADGLAQQRGALLAVERHNARAGIAFRLALDTADDRGTAAGARSVARRLTGAGVSAVLGPVTAAAALSAGPLYEQARTAMVLVSVDDDRLGGPGTRTACVTRGPEALLALPLTTYLTSVRPVEHTAVIEDRAAGAVGSALVESLTRTPPHQGTTSVHSVAADRDDFAPAVRSALAAGARAVVFSGVSPQRAARCARALADAGFTGPRLGTWHVMSAAFLQQAGAAGQDWVFGAPFTDPGSVSATFRTAHRARFGTPPGRWSAEAYDAVRLVAGALELSGGAATVEPGTVTQRLYDVDLQGLAKRLRFASDGTSGLAPEGAYFLFRATGDTFRFLGRHDRVG